ncbi:MAG: hypothetical protein IJ218_01035 [Alphaproteobacteria bacterium]|nr:hypothetical protein [Alphaproteobacteria bacterium]
MKKQQEPLTPEDTTVSHELFGLIPLFSITTDGDFTIYVIIGLPIWIVQHSVNYKKKMKTTRYYLFGFPVAEIDDEVENDEKADIDRYFNTKP